MTSQDIATVVEAMLWERADGTQEGWQDIMDKVEDNDFLARSWPTALCSTDEAVACSRSSLTRSCALYQRDINRYLKGKVTAGKARVSAERILARTQVYMPPADMSLKGHSKVARGPAPPISTPSKGPLPRRRSAGTTAPPLTRRTRSTSPKNGGTSATSTGTWSPTGGPR